MSTDNLQVGDKAPDFNAPDQGGNLVKLSDYLGKKVCLYFYPKDNTPGCTAQSCSLRDDYDKLSKAGWEILGVSVDSVASHKKFVTKYNLPFTLVADEDKTIVQAYKVWGEKKFMGRTYMGTKRMTFLIDDKGIITNIIAKPNTSKHAQEVLELT